MRTKKSFKLIYDENRLLYAKRYPTEEHSYDPVAAQLFLDQFHAKRRRQKKNRGFIFIFSCIITSGLVVGITKSLNILIQ